VYHLCVFVFVLLYNLYLLDAGFSEDFLGLVAGAATAGSLAGSIPAAWALRKLGLKRTVVLTALSMGAVSAARGLGSQEAALLATAFAAGGLTSLWFVSIAPTVSALTGERNRPLGFSLWRRCCFGRGCGNSLRTERKPLAGGEVRQRAKRDRQHVGRQAVKPEPSRQQPHQKHVG
jgi:MFS family permease